MRRSRGKRLGDNEQEEGGRAGERTSGGDLWSSLVELCPWLWQPSPVVTPIKLYRI